MKRRQALVVAGVIVLGVVAALAVGLALSTRGTGSAASSRATISTTDVPAGKAMVAETGSANAPGAAGAPAAAAGGASADGGPNTPDASRQLVVVNATMSLRVKDVHASLEAIRAATRAAGGTVSDLSVSSGPGEPPVPEPYPTDTATRAQPTNATVTVRVPVAALPALEKQLGSLGELVSQTSSASDVTQQHVDMAARLKNLRAEEAQLRQILRRAGSVSALLEVERELSRVRGDIESLQAQLAYLENQAALATLTITLQQPGALVRPASSTWGIADAFTAGVQAAAGLIAAFVTGAVALSPIVVIALLVWIAWRSLRRLRRGKLAEAPGSGANER